MASPVRIAGNSASKCIFLCPAASLLEDNCQNAVSLFIANHFACLPIGYRMYLPEAWVDDEERRKAGVPVDVRFQTKPEIALKLIRQACREGAPAA